MNNQPDNGDNGIEKSELSWEEESKIWQAMAGADVIKDLGPISKEDYDYYENLCLKLVSQAKR